MQPGWPKHETRDFRPLPTALVGLALLGTLALLGLGLWPLQSKLVPADRSLRPPPSQSAAGEAEFESGEMRAALYAGAEMRLHSYGWVDRSRGIAHIPIERAMEILARSREGSERP